MTADDSVDRRVKVVLIFLDDGSLPRLGPMLPIGTARLLITPGQPPERFRVAGVSSNASTTTGSRTVRPAAT